MTQPVTQHLKKTVTQQGPVKKNTSDFNGRVTGFEPATPTSRIFSAAVPRRSLPSENKVESYT